jgi:hypothetical protein
MIPFIPSLHCIGLHWVTLRFITEWALFGYFLLLLFATFNSTWICEIEILVHPQMYT